MRCCLKIKAEQTARKRKYLKNIDERYDKVYQKCIVLCPDMQELIEKIRRIPPPGSNECKTLCERKENGDSKALNRMIEMYLRTALKFSLAAAEETSLPLDEIFSEAVIGLSEAVNRYDHQTHKAFASYVISGIRQGINAYIRQNNSYIPLSMQFSKIVQIVKAEKEKYSSESYYFMSRKISEVTMFNLKEVQLALFYTETPMSYEEYCKNNEYIGYDGEKYLIERVYNAQARKILENAIKSLTEREKEIIQLKYGLGSQGRYTVKEIADMYYIDKERIRSIEDKALRKLKYKQEIKMLWQL